MTDASVTLAVRRQRRAGYVRPPSMTCSASTATRNAVPGVGLGLTITKAIVTAHGGRLDIQSEEGVGTSISLRLPVETPKPVAEAVPGAERAS